MSDNKNNLKNENIWDCLVLYIPFELYTIDLGVPILTPSLTDIKTPNRVISGSNANGSGLNTETAKIKLQRPIEAINFT